MTTRDYRTPEIDDRKLDDVMLVIANFTPAELEEFAALRGMTADEWREIIKNWKEDRLS